MPIKAKIISEYLDYGSSFCGVTLVGVGPGDPSLLTLAAVKAINKANVVSYPVAKEGCKGMAEQIAEYWISPEQKKLPILFPMVSDSQILKQSWMNASDQVSEMVFQGESVVFLCEGDVSLFSTSSYLLLDLKARHQKCPVRLIPGITSIAAAAAIGQWPLALQNDQLLITSTPENAETLQSLLEDAALLGQVVALLKIGDRWKWLRPLLGKMNLLEGALFAQRVGWDDQNVVEAKYVDENTKPYFSLLLVRQSWPKVVP